MSMKDISRTKEDLLRELDELRKENANLKEIILGNKEEHKHQQNEISHSGEHSAAAPANEQKNTEQNLRQLFDDYLKMYASRDDNLTAYFSENFSGFTGGGDFLVKNREEWIAITRQDFAQVKEPLRIEMKDLSIQSLTESIAVTTAFFTIHLPIKDHVLSRETARLVLIFRKESAGWKITHSSISIPYYLVQEGEVYPMKELVERNQLLEELISERTSQLFETNEHLKKTNKELAKEITDRKRTEKELLQSNQKLEAINSATPDGIGMISLDGKIQLIMSDKLPQMYGYSIDQKKDLVGKSVFDFIDSSDHKILKENIRKLISGENSEHLSEYHAIRKDGSRFYVDVNSAILFDSNNEPASIIFVERDISERKKAELTIREQYDQLNELNATKDKLFSIIAHDLRSPFQSLLSSSELLAGGIESLSLKDIKSAGNGLNNSLKNLYGLLENLLNWSMMQRGMLEFNPQNINLYDIVFKLIEITNSSAVKKDISFSNIVDKNNLVFADEDMLRSVIQNLITNAIKFTPEKGSIIISSEEKDGFVEVSIKDSGVGIEEEKSSQMFNFGTFYSTRGTSGEKGTGLGLSLCKEFVEKNGGKIWVVSKLGKGSMFTFTLRKIPGN